MALQHKYRPKSFKRVVGNRTTVKAIETQMARPVEDRPHAILITGPSGVGKTTLARIIRTELECHDHDYIEMDAADFRGIDTIRNMRQQMPYASAFGPVRVWCLDECHQLTSQAQEALLKALEDTPSHCYIILCTTDPQKLRPTLKRRCAHHQLSPVPATTILNHLKAIVKREGAEVETTILEDIANEADGSIGIAMGRLDKLIDLDPELMKKAAKEEQTKQTEIKQLCQALLYGKSSWNQVADIIRNLDAEPETVRRAVLGWASVALLNNNNPKAFGILEAFAPHTYDTGKPGLVLAAYDAFTRSE